MNIVKGLIIKDLLNLKNYMKSILCIIVFYILLSFINNDLGSFLTVFIPICFGMIGISSFNYDNLSKSDEYILTFPTTRKNIVKSRYLYIIVLTLVGTILGFVLSIIIQNMMQSTSTNIGEILALSIGAFSGMTIVQAIQIPIMYKFGAEKGRIIQMITIVAVMLIASGIIALIVKIFPISIESFFFILQGYEITIATAIIIYLISYKVSLKIFSKKEI